MNSIVEESMARNSARGITGYLYYDDFIFIQEIEGVQQDVEDVYALICSDDRHADIRTILKQDADTRVFGEWTMAFHDGQNDGGLLRMTFGPEPSTTLANKDGEDVLRFLRELSLGREDLLRIASTGPLANV